MWTLKKSATLNNIAYYLHWYFLAFFWYQLPLQNETLQGFWLLPCCCSELVPVYAASSLTGHEHVLPCCLQIRQVNEMSQMVRQALMFQILKQQLQSLCLQPRLLSLGKHSTWCCHLCWMLKETATHMPIKKGAKRNKIIIKTAYKGKWFC